MSKDKGMLIVVSGPSGVGKGVVCNQLRKLMEKQLTYSISATTRTKRATDCEGVTYFFKSHTEFQRMIDQNELLEWAEYVGNYYGTPRQFVEESLASGSDVLLEIDVRGAAQVKKHFPEGIFIFLLPPAFSDLKTRINKRGTEQVEIVEKRLQKAQDEINQVHHYDYAVINDKIKSTAISLQTIIAAEHFRVNMTIQKYKGMVIKDVISFN